MRIFLGVGFAPRFRLAGSGGCFAGLAHLFRGDHLTFRDGSREHHEQSAGVVLHASLDAVVDDIHQVDPVLFVFTSHARVSLVGNVVECLCVCVGLVT